MIETRSFSSSTSPLTIPKKVCMIFPAPSPEFEHGYDIFIVDLNTDLRDLSPTIRVVGECFKSAALCVVGTTLYVFEGHDDERGPRGKTVFLYDFSEHDPSGGLITLSGLEDLNPVCSMNDIKTCPRAISTPDGKKIVVFSSSIPPLDSPSLCNFELFDPFSKNCENLPDLFGSGFSIGPVEFVGFLDNDEDDLIVQAYVPNHSQNMVDFPSSGMFKLNLGLLDDNWETFLFEDQKMLDFQFQVIGGDIFLNPVIAHQVKICCPAPPPKDELYSYILHYTFPTSDGGFSPPRDAGLDRDITLVDYNDDQRQDGHRLFCVLQNWEDDVEEGAQVVVPWVILDVYKCDISECKKKMVEREEKQREEMKSDPKNGWKRWWKPIKLPGTELVKSFEIKLDPQPAAGPPRIIFPIRSFFSIP